MTDRLIITTSANPFTRGLDYLYGVRGLALEPEMVNVVHDLDRRVAICTWIGEHIDAVNLQLETCLQACCDCFHLWEQPAIQIFAAPLAQGFGVDGICNFQTHPITLLVDVGRVQPQDWLALVAHEYAHAHAGSPGHHSQFARSLSHLCLGLGIAPPPEEWGMQPSSMANRLRFYPYCPPTEDPLAFWCGG
ncbi:MAG: hypothetical protein KME15_09100 [Drouetiella hepatica Uher 2000/2452]|uniref:Uncharacterized protein n=1 Tax=Drouetiella hepatica Uher 2000/2452 TaxID=904376 RepID=A0A951ULX7_9CYAN|nr:hypothetical protein [Drouetiella hepatica Uher 2000/2452]